MLIFKKEKFLRGGPSFTIKKNYPFRRNIVIDAFMLETLKLSKTLKLSRDNFNVSSIKMANLSFN